MMTLATLLLNKWNTHPQQTPQQRYRFDGALHLVQSETLWAALRNSAIHMLSFSTPLNAVGGLTAYKPIFWNVCD